MFLSLLVHCAVCDLSRFSKGFRVSADRLTPVKMCVGLVGYELLTGLYVDRESLESVLHPSIRSAASSNREQKKGRKEKRGARSGCDFKLLLQSDCKSAALITLCSPLEIF